MENLALPLECAVTDMTLSFLAGSDATTIRAMHIPRRSETLPIIRQEFLPP
jgi:hypothetical protein